MAKADNTFMELKDKTDVLSSVELDFVGHNVNMALLFNKEGDVSVEQILPIDAEILVKLLKVDENHDDNSVDDGGDTNKSAKNRRLKVFIFKGCVRYIFASLFLGLNKSTCQIKKNVFYFTSKPLFVLKKIKF